VEDAVTRVYRGSIAPISGWASRGFDEKQPAPTIWWRHRLEGERVLRSVIVC